MRKESQNAADFLQIRDKSLTQHVRKANQNGALPTWSGTAHDSRRMGMVSRAVESGISTRAAHVVSPKGASTMMGGCRHSKADDGAEPEENGNGNGNGNGNALCASKRAAFMDAYEAAADCLTEDDLSKIATPDPDYYPMASSVTMCTLVVAIVLSFSVGMYTGSSLAR